MASDGSSVLLPKEFLRKMIADGNLEIAIDLHLYFKEMFKHTLQEMLEADRLRGKE